MRIPLSAWSSQSSAKLHRPLSLFSEASRTQVCSRDRTHLVGVLELEAADDASLQLCVVAGLVQHGLAELGDVGTARLPQDRVQPVVCEDGGGGGGAQLQRNSF